MRRNRWPASAGITGRHRRNTQRARLQLYSSPVLLEELAEVLTRPWAAKQLRAIGKAARDVLPDYILAIELIEPAELPRVVRDPDDDHVLACALAARTDLIVTGDNDLLDLNAYQDIPIITAAEALRRIEPQR